MIYEELTVSTKLPAIWFGSVLKAGLRSSKYPIRFCSTHHMLLSGIVHYIVILSSKSWKDQVLYRVFCWLSALEIILIDLLDVRRDGEVHSRI